MKKNRLIFSSIAICFIALLFVFSPKSNESAWAAPIPAPDGTQINITYTTGLDWADCEEYPNHEMKVTFYGSRYSDMQNVWDPNSPFTFPGWYFQNPSYALCSNFYYRSGRAYVYSRQNASSSWDFQGDMQMTSSNCVMMGSKVTYFTVDCRYLSNPTP